MWITSDPYYYLSPYSLEQGGVSPPLCLRYWNFLVIKAPMWKKTLQGIKDRLTALETSQEPRQDLDELRDTLGSAQTEIVALRASQEGFSEATTSIEARLKDLVFAVAEGIERVERYERRIKATIKRARNELAQRGFEHEGLEAEAHELREVRTNGAEGTEDPVRPLNAASGQEEWVQPVRLGVAPNSKANAVRAKFFGT